MINLIDAIKAIKADAKIYYYEEDISTLVWGDGNPTNITNEQILAKRAELQADYDAKEYQRDRSPGREARLKGAANFYPSIGDQLDMIYHDQVDGTTTFKDAIQVVKDAHPKP